MKHNENILEGRKLSKTFGNVIALNNVNMSLKRNEILAIVGDNGAGKSTLIKILSGALLPDAGEIFVDGARVQLYKPRDAKNVGIETVYQHLALVEPLSISKNLFLGKEIIKKFIFLNILQNKEMRSRSTKFLKELGIDIKDANQKVETLSGGQRQSVAISKSVFWSDKILILDEPTAALGVRESAKILDMIVNLKKKGLSIIIITHNMEHAFSIADRFLVIRLGKNIGERNRAETNINEIVKMITGGIFINNRKTNLKDIR